MAAPDVTVDIQSAATPSTAPTNTGQAFAATVTQRGSSVQPMAVSSKQDYATKCGARQTTSVASDWVETYLAEGGKIVWVSRVFGAGALQASLNLMDSSAAISLVAKAGLKGDPDPGTWANGATGGLGVAVVANGSGYQIQTYLNGQLVETSPILVTQADAINWANDPVNGSNYLVISLGVSTNPPAVAAASNLAGGTDGSAVDSTARQAALDRIPKELGPGQITAPGVTTSSDQLAVIAHAVANNRFAVLDAADTSTSSTLISAAASLYAAPNTGRRWGELHAPWEIIPGLTQNTRRTVPPSARACAQYAQVDALGNPNQPAAGDFGTAQFVIDLSQPNWDAPTRDALNTAGVVVSRRRYAGKIVTYGIVSLADQINDPAWATAAGARTVMAYNAQAAVIGEDFFARQVDGFGHAQSDFKAALTGPAMTLFGVGALYNDPGTGPETAFKVDTGPTLNPPSQLQNRILVAAVELRTSPAPDKVLIHITKLPITQSV